MFTSIHAPRLTYIPKEVEKIYLNFCFPSEDGGNYFVPIKNFSQVFQLEKKALTKPYKLYKAATCTTTEYNLNGVL